MICPSASHFTGGMMSPGWTPWAHRNHRALSRCASTLTARRAGPSRRAMPASLRARRTISEEQPASAPPVGLTGAGCREGRTLRGERGELARTVLAGRGVDPVDTHDPLVALLADRGGASRLPSHAVGPPLCISTRPFL